MVVVELVVEEVVELVVDDVEVDEVEVEDVDEVEVEEVDEVEVEEVEELEVEEEVLEDVVVVVVLEVGAVSPAKRICADTLGSLDELSPKLSVQVQPSAC